MNLSKKNKLLDNSSRIRSRFNSPIFVIISLNVDSKYLANNLQELSDY